MMQMLDLFSGLGGASEAFLQNGWHVIRIDNNPMFGPGGKNEVPHTITSDVIRFRNTFEPKTIDFLWASPPCNEFSLAYPAPRSVAAREGVLDLYKPDMKPLEATLAIIKAIKPRYWAIENVQGAIRYFEPYIGRHRVKYGS